MIEKYENTTNKQQTTNIFLCFTRQNIKPSTVIIKKTLLAFVFHFQLVLLLLLLEL